MNILYIKNRRNRWYIVAKKIKFTAAKHSYQLLRTLNKITQILSNSPRGQIAPVTSHFRVVNNEKWKNNDINNEKC